MFTGIVQAMGRIAAIKRQPTGVRLVVDRMGWQPPGLQLGMGDSVCISGVCLTIAGLTDRRIEFDVIHETLAKTTLGSLKVASPVNLEPSLTPTSQLGGHFVQGHVEGVGVVRRVKRTGGERRITIEPPDALEPFVIAKGSIAIDGVSMTIASVSDDSGFDVAVIPTTLRLTTLGKVARGWRVNLETDIITRTVVEQLRNMRRDTAQTSSITRQTLKKAGLSR